jgi:hypothetical protein
MNHTNQIYFFLGLSLWVPGISVLDIGNGSLQISALLATLIIFFNVKLIDNFIIKLILFYLLFIFLQLFYLIIYKDEFDLLIKGNIFFIPSVALIIVGYLVIKLSKFDIFFRGYLIGGLISSIIGILQYIFWKYYSANLFFLEYFNSNRSFSLYYKNIDTMDALRIFSLMPEPSLLFINLSPLIFIFLYFKKFLYFSLFLLTGYLTGSVNLIFMLISMIYIYIYNKLNLNYMLNLFLNIITFCTIVYFIYNAYVLSNEVVYQFRYYDNIIDRVIDLINNGSFISRLNSIVNAFSLFIQNPLLGLGIQGNELSSYLVDNSTSIEVNIGINSILFSVIVWFGILGLLIFAPLLFFCLSYDSIATKIFVLSIILSSIFALSYYNFYTFWLAIGITLFSISPYKKTMHVTNK